MKSIISLSVFVLLLFTSCQTSNDNNNNNNDNRPEAQREITFHPSHIAERKNTPFSAAVETEDFLFLSGQIGKDHLKGTLVEGGIQAETKQAIENINAVLKQHNSSLNRVVKCTVILADIDDFAAFNQIYVQYFQNKPARTTFAAGGLAAGAKIEIDVIAAK